MTWRPFVVPVACWGTAWALGAASLMWAVATAMVAALVAIAVGVTFRRGQLRRSRHVLLLVGATAVCAVAGSSAMQTHAWQSQPWSTWTQQRASVEVVFRLSHTPVPVTTTPWADADAQTVQTAKAVMVSAVGDGVAWSTNARVLARIPGDTWDARLRRGDTIRGTARVAPGERRAAVVARLEMLEVVAVQPDSGWSGHVDRAFRAVLSGLSPDTAALVQGLAVGEDADLSPATRAEIRAAGLGHLTAVSGANIAMVVGVAMWAARVVGASRAQALLPAAAALVGYVGLVGPEPSVMRAAVMATVALAGVLLGGGSGLTALASAVTVLLVWDPGLASSRGFALSCAATVGLILAAPSGRRAVEWVNHRVRAPFAVPVTVLVAALATAVAAAAATAPLLASYGEGVSWVAIVANVLVAPVVPLVTIGGLGVMALAVVAAPLAEVVAWVPGLGAAWIVRVGHWASTIPGGRLSLPGTWQSGAVVAVTFLGLAGLAKRWPKAPLWAATTAVVAAIGHASMPPVWRGVPPDWAVVFCDVGQGDATILRAGPDSAVLVDAGPEPDAAVRCLRRVGVARADAVVLSHFHRDHVEGFPRVAESLRPSQVWVSPLAEPPVQAGEVRSAANAYGSQVSVPTQGQKSQWGAVAVEVLGPGRLVREGSAPNNASIVLVADVATDAGSVRVLLSGDVEPEAQAALMSAVSDPNVDVAKVPHHGSANQHPAYARWAGALWAVVSCGVGNDYGHPADSTLRDWQASGATTVRTDINGDVFITVEPGRVIRAHVTGEAGGG